MIRIITDYLGTLPGCIRFAGSLFLGRKIRKAAYYLFEHTPEKLDWKRFEDNMEYLFLLFRKRS